MVKLGKKCSQNSLKKKVPIAIEGMKEFKKNSQIVSRRGI
jgi:hypothetical protein